MVEKKWSILVVGAEPAMAQTWRRQLEDRSASSAGSGSASESESATAVGRGVAVCIGAASDLDAGAAHDAVLLHVAGAEALQAWATDPRLERAAADTALVVVTDVVDAACDDDLLQVGVQAVVRPDADLPRVMRQAVLRRRVDRAARLAYATDLATGLPHEAQLLEHLTQLLALREREPGPMALIVLRIHGAERATADLGAAAANLLRRKIAVRLRSRLRSGDVVAAIGPDTFGVLLGQLEAAAHGDAVAAKLLRSLQDPLTVSGRACRVSADVGMAHHPAHGKDAATLLQRATAQALSLATMGQGGADTSSARGRPQAANDDAPGADGRPPSP